MVSTTNLDQWLVRTDATGRRIVVDKSHCDVWIGGRWELVGVSLVYPNWRRRILRCPVCHGPIRLEAAGGRMRDRMEHESSNPGNVGCPLFYRFSGVPSRNPKPVAPPIEGEDQEGAWPDDFDEAKVTAIIGNVTSTERMRLIRARIGQGFFREQLIRLWVSCSVTGAGPDEVLVASHVVPWSKCKTNAERIDVFNGLLLTPNLDKLFDRGLVSFSDDGRIIISDRLSTDDCKAFGVSPKLRLRHVPPSLVPYLVRHRTEGHFKPSTSTSTATASRSANILANQPASNT